MQYMHLGRTGLVRQSVVTAPNIGPSILLQFDESLRAVEIILSPEVRARLDGIFPGPGDTGPGSLCLVIGAIHAQRKCVESRCSLHRIREAQKPPPVAKTGGGSR